MSANFSPELLGYTGQGPFRWWCQSVLPLVYDDSLSYYEVLNKVTNYLNNTIADVANVETNVANIAVAFNDLQEYVNTHIDAVEEDFSELQTYVKDYFANLNLTEEVTNILNTMAENGTMTNIINGIFDSDDSPIPAAVTTWLTANVDPVGSAVAVDSSLTISGAAADAKITGDKVNELKKYVKYSSVDYLAQYSKPTKSTDHVTIAWNGDIATVNGTPTSASEAIANYYSNSIALPDGINAGDTLYIKVKTTNKNIRLGIIPYVSGASQTAIYFTSDSTWKVPSNVTGMIIRISLIQNRSYSNDTFEAYILSSPANIDIDNLANENREMLVNYNSVDYLLQFNKPTISTSNITLSWAGNVATVNGRATSAAEAIANYYSDSSAFPDGIKAGDTLYIKVKTSNDYIRLGIIPYIGETAQTAIYFTTDTKWVVPSSVTGMIIRISIIQNVTYDNETFEAYILNAPTNGDIVTVKNILDKTRNSLSEYNSEVIISANSDSSRTHNGIVYTWNDNSVCTVSGTATAASFCNVYVDYNALPGNLSEGDKFYFDYKTTDTKARGVLLFYNQNQTNVGTIGTDRPIEVTVPANAVGAIVRISVNNGLTVNGTVVLKLLTAESNWDLQSDIDAIENRVGRIVNTPMLTIIDDDGHSKFYTDLYPLVGVKKVSISAAIPFTSIGTANHLTMEQVKTMHGDGVEVLSHTYSHWTDFTGKTEQDFELDYRKAKYSFGLNGIDCNIIVYAGSSGNLSAAKEAAKRVYDGGIASGNENINYCTSNKYFIERYGVNGDGSSGRLNGESLEDLESAIDDVKNNGGWMIWMLHTSANYWTNTMLSNIADAIDYALANGVQIVSAEYGFKTYFGA